MKFLIDAQRPRRLRKLFAAAGRDATHTLDLPNGNRTTDQEIHSVSTQEQRVVVAKDSDFVNSFLLSQLPWKLLLISTGNISNKDLDALVSPLIATIENTFQAHSYAELTRTAFIIHA